MEHQWSPITVDEVTRRFAAVDVDWWVAGGVAIDCFLGWKSRHHDDLDLEMFREDCRALWDAFAGWELFLMSDDTLSRWHSDEEIDASVFRIWGRPTAGAPWAFEVLLAEGDSNRWRYRRDSSVSLSRSALTRKTLEGIRYCTPEVQLLYKAMKRRAKDDVDLARTLHLMSTDQKMWLADAIERAEGDHPWVAVLECST